jgi:two-component system, cell cycle response regulator DivK
MKRLLLVEDNELNRDMLSRRLTKRGFQVWLAADGRQAVELTRELLPDAILMDLSLPEINGWDATRTIKADVRTGQIPVIVLTAHALAEEKEKALAAGADGFTTKPVDLDELLRMLSELIDVTTGV